MRINSGKCAILWFRPRFAKSCAPISWQGNTIGIVINLSILVTLSSRSKFSVDVS